MPALKILKAISDEYNIGEELGKGTYGTVHVCSRITNPDVKNLVIKKIDLQRTKRKEIADLVKEAKLLQMFDHPNVRAHHLRLNAVLLGYFPYYISACNA